MPSDAAGNGEKVARTAARGVLLNMMANAALVVGIPVAGFFAMDLIGTLKANTAAINEIKIALVGVTDANVSLTGRLEGFERTSMDRMTGIQNSQMSRFDAQGKRIDKVEGDVDRLKERVWSMPVPAPPTSSDFRPQH